MVAPTHQGKVLYVIICNVPVPMVDVVALGDFAVVVFPHGAVKSFSVSLEIVTAEVVVLPEKFLLGCA